jgi:methionyl aminopeptidase
MIIQKSKKELSVMREAGKIAYEALRVVQRAIKPGVKTAYLDRLAEKYILQQGAFPAFKGYRGYQASICVSLNNEVVHGIPSNRKIKQGDLVSIDLGVKYRDYHGDIAATFIVGEVSKETKKLVEVTKKALEAGIEQCQAGNHLFDISAAIQEEAEKAGFSVVRQFVGHGIGRKLHEAPQVPNFGERGRGPILKPGMTFALEPMVNMGGWEVEVLSDGWTVVTVDRSLSAHFEHTVVVTEDGPWVLTKG